MGPPDPLRCSERYADDLGGHDAAVIDKLLVSLTATDTASAWLDNKSPHPGRIDSKSDKLSPTSGVKSPQALTRSHSSCLPRTEIFNTASETSTSRTIASSKKAILIALLEPARKSGTPQSETDAGFANQNSLPVRPWSMTFSSISPISQRADFRPRFCRIYDR